MIDDARRRALIRAHKRAAWCLLWVAASLGLVYLLLLEIGLAPGTQTCMTETRATVHNLAGFDFEVVEVDCDMFAHDASLTVFALKPARGPRERATLIRYDPGGDDAPVIRSPAPGVVEIAIHEISSMFFCRNHIAGLEVHYTIGHIYYPSGDDKCQ